MESLPRLHRLFPNRLKLSGFVDYIKKKKEGIGALDKGTTAILIRAFPANAVRLYLVKIFSSFVYLGMFSRL